MKKSKTKKMTAKKSTSEKTGSKKFVLGKTPTTAMVKTEIVYTANVRDAIVLHIFKMSMSNLNGAKQKQKRNNFKKICKEELIILPR